MISSVRNVRPPRQPRRLRTHPTRERLLATTLALVERMDIAEITGDMVLEQSGISRGSLYYHFADFSDLLEQALVRRFAALVDASVADLARLPDVATSRDAMLATMRQTVKAVHTPANAPNRFFRARIIALAETNPRLMQGLAAEQQRLTDSLAALFVAAQDKGWMHRDFDPAVAAVFVQSYTLGRVIDDVSINRVDPDKWDDLIERTLRLLFC